MFLNQDQAVEKYTWLTKNILKNLLFKDINGFRSKVAKKIGRRIFLDEGALLKFFADASAGSNVSYK
jgi:hypothetical protein